MESLKENIHHEVHLLGPKSLENSFRVVRKAESKNMATRRITTSPCREYNAPSPNLNQHTRLAPQQLDERRA